MYIDEKGNLVLDFFIKLIRKFKMKE